ncbi:MAG: polysaccharide deacetylase family protein [Bacteroidetes bacterium]|nr:polysaccharide deacetylase family protein [Bacteroidota bacterium]
MTNYRVKMPRWIKKLFPKELVWKMPPDNNPSVYLTFDDGPHPTATYYILEQLNKYNAKATFFCIGKNVVKYPEVFEQIIKQGHTVANHTHNHMNGWHSDNRPYLSNILKAARHINSHSFRPPYGRIKISQAKRLQRAKPAWRIYMWDVLSGDFDVNISPQQCLDNVLTNIEPGSIVVFHDSDKAWERMSYALPGVLEYCKQQNWEMKALPQY